MSMLTLFVVVAFVAVIASLAAGISAMVMNGDVGHRTSAEWMDWRVAFQTAAVVLILLALLGSR